MSTRFDRLTDEFTRLEDENNSFKKMNKEIQDKLNIMKFNNEELTEQNEVLEEEYHKLKKQMQVLESAIPRGMSISGAGSFIRPNFDHNARSRGSTFKGANDL